VPAPPEIHHAFKIVTVGGGVGVLAIEHGCERSRRR